MDINVNLSANSTDSSIPPSYGEMLESVGKNLLRRKGGLSKRVLLIVFPSLIFFIFLFVLTFFSKNNTLQGLGGNLIITLYLSIPLLALFTTIYVLIIRTIFSLEKHIWIDSYFDKKNLDYDASWKIAKKLFFPALKFRFKLFFKYYAPIFLPLIAVFLLIPFFIILKKMDTTPVFDLIYTLSFFIITTSLGLYIRAKLRYAWFIFLDFYNPISFSSESAIQELNKLNQISKSETFKKALIANLGSDIFETISRLMVQKLRSVLSAFGVGGKLFGGIVSIYGKEMARQTADFGKISAVYVLYSFARGVAYGESQKINDYIYNLEI